jgi:hypothetical protein
VSMQGLSAAIRENQKVGRCEIEIIFRDFDTETTWHEREGTEKANCFQGATRKSER